ncbi:MAG: 16S rRNA (adenine(1518)-N(6)/adenine(1519)-N(6))-dimethyltransferase RsmA [Clostridiales Family XIII bacterium]|jgi:16S rRNA (adenine1518-N6/adenine1519-N6)-dimethyltransferase|nr:16S rRNA (adenine(1518)-N(6)/adenine(1519)-N(6))-dimethyltransferase RsmA [Clostridiales Family XIII bacterium]
MREPYNKSELAALCKAFGFTFSKSLGQNFLVDRNIAAKIADACGLDAGADVVEIGAGAGALTVLLAARARRVFAVELDGHLIPMLSAVCEGLPNVTVLHEDFLKIEPGRLSPRYVLAGNLPYQITSQVLAKAAEGAGGAGAMGGGGGGDAGCLRMVFMVQKEVADRLLAAPGGRTYGAISVLVQYHCEPELVCDVSREVFMPKPKVGSAVVRLTPRGNAADDPAVTARMFRLVKAGFGQRRKTLRNALASAGYPEDTLLAALEAAGIDPARRAETLGPRDWYRLAEAL